VSNIKEVNELKMKKLPQETLILLLIFTTCLSLIDVQCVKGDSDHCIVIYVDRRLYNDQDIGAAIDRYVADIQNEGWSTLKIFENATNITPAAIRSVLVVLLSMYNIEGCVLVGDFPSAKWVNGTSYYTDYYYMDLNGTWTDADSPPQGKRFNNHTGHIRPEIWVGRLMASTIDDPTRDEKKLFLDYFAKNHGNRNASSRAEQTHPGALAYVDNSPAYGGSTTNESDYGYDTRFVNDTVASLKKAYSDVTLVSSPLPNATNTNATDYKNRLKSTGYEWTWVYDHGQPDSHAFANYAWNGTQWVWQEWNEGGVSSAGYYIPDTPKTFFYIFGSCSAAVFTTENCIANSAIFGKGKALSSIGMTTDGVFPASWFSEAFEQLGQHESIGEAFKTMYNSMIDYYDGSWVNKKIVLLGDPTIRINSPPYVPSQPSGEDSGYLEVTYDYTTNTTDLNGDQIWYQFNWDDGTYTTVGPYDSGESGNASHAWSCPGTYTVKVRAKDNYTTWSDWSQPLNVTINERIRYMQNAKWDSTYWKLFWNNTITWTDKYIIKQGWYLWCELGVKIYKGTTCISGSSVITVGRWYNLETGLQSTTWDCSEHNVTGTYIKIEVYCKFAGSSWQNMGVAFKTETFTENTILNATEWTIYLYGEFQMEWGPEKVGTATALDKSWITFYWGSSSRESRIEDMAFTYG
jgi:hypothetical protein